MLNKGGTFILFEEKKTLESRGGMGQEIDQDLGGIFVEDWSKFGDLVMKIENVGSMRGHANMCW